MTGVEILAIEEVAVAFTFSWKVFLVCSPVFFIVIAAVVGITTFDDCIGNSLILGLICGVIFGPLFGVLLARDTAITEYETHYKVTISEDVKMTEFLERYEIVDQEGKIYTVRERGDDHD